MVIPPAPGLLFVSPLHGSSFTVPLEHYHRVLRWLFLQLHSVVTLGENRRVNMMLLSLSELAFWFISMHYYFYVLYECIFLEEVCGENLKYTVPHQTVEVPATCGHWDWLVQ